MSVKTAGAGDTVELERETETLDEGTPGTSKPVKGRKRSTGPAGKSAKSETEQRLHIVFTPRMMERLEYLKESTEAASYAEVLRHAMRIYDALYQEVEDGHEILVRDPKSGESVACRFW